MILLFFCLLLASCANDVALPQKVNVLSVGISYEGTDTQSLKGTENDARELFLAFGERYEQKEGALLLENTKGEFLLALEQLPSSSLTLIIFSGHGMEDGSWVFLDPEAKQFDANGKVKQENLLSPSELWEAVRKRPEPVLVISDSCYSGNLLPPGGTVSSPNGNDGEVSLCASSSTRFALACTTKNNTGKENRDSHRHGFFTKALLDALGWDHERLCQAKEVEAMPLDALYEEILSRQELPLAGNKRQSQHPVVSSGPWELWI